MTIKSLKSTRAYVITALEQIQQGQSLSSLLDHVLQQVTPTDKAFAHELLLGTLRQWWALSRVVESLVKNEITDKGIVAGLHIGLYQLLYLQTPDYAAIGETVEAIKQLDKGYGAGLVNAVLRKVQKSPNKYLKKIEKNHSLPNWLAKTLKQDWPMYYDELGRILRQPAPIFLRVNQQKTNVTDYGQLLANQHIDFNIVPIGVNQAQAIRLVSATKITDLPYFMEGWVSVQDLHAQLSANIIASKNLGNNATILDACAAPGGKTAYLLETFHVKHLLALDNDAPRLARVQENLTRLSLLSDNVELVQADASTFSVDQKSDKKFDLILLDAPCTATGVIRRHPDIALLRQANDVEQTVALQADILRNCWQQLANDGYLLYVTCSLLKAENENQLRDFLATHPEAVAVDFDLTLDNQVKRPIGWQCLPLDREGGDGFYYALLQKRR